MPSSQSSKRVRVLPNFLVVVEVEVGGGGGGGFL